MVIPVSCNSNHSSCLPTDISERTDRSQGTGLQVLQLVLWGNQLPEPEQFTLNIQDIISLVTGWFCVNETKKWTELPFHNFPDLPEMASGSQTTNLTRLSASTDFQVLAHKDFWFMELMYFGSCRIPMEKTDTFAQAFNCAQPYGRGAMSYWSFKVKGHTDKIDQCK